MPVKKGTRRAPLVALVGERFGHLVITEEAPRFVHGTRHLRMVRCRCDCGGEKTALVTNLRAGYTTSCGCVRLARAAAALTTHAMSDAPEYVAWMAMRKRCRDPNATCYHRYGGRGITVCEGWHNFKNFISDMGPRPSPHHSIDRKDVNGNYEPENCRWATSEMQANNRRNNRFIAFQGETKTLAQWARALSIPYSKLKQRVRKGRWP